MINKQIFRIKKDGTPTAKCICRHPELIENYDKATADTTQSWICHHRLETHNSDGKQRLVNIKAEELIALDIYFNRPPEELIFLTKADHMAIHNEGKKLSEEWKAKLSAGHKGKPSNRKGKHLSEETKKKISEAQKGKKRPPRSKEWKRKISEALKGKHWKIIDGKRINY